MTNYATNYANKSSIFDNGDVIEGHHVKSIYDELGEMPGTLSEVIAPAVDNYWYSSASTVANDANPSVQNRQYFVPFYVSNTGYTVTSLSIYVETPTVGASSVYAGIYGSANGLPDGSLLATKVTFSTTGSTGARTATTSIPLDRGLYWISCVATASSPATLARITASRVAVPLPSETTSYQNNVGLYLSSKTDLLAVSSSNTFIQADSTTNVPHIIAKCEIV